jgi:hypothetical protein
MPSPSKRLVVVIEMTLGMSNPVWGKAYTVQQVSESKGRIKKFRVK